MHSLFSGFKVFNPLWMIQNFFTLWGTGSNGVSTGIGGQTSTSFGNKGGSAGTKTTTTVVPKKSTTSSNPTPTVCPPPPKNDNTIGGSSTSGNSNNGGGNGSGTTTANISVQLPTTKTNVVTDVDIIQTNVGKEQQMYMRAKTIQFEAEGLKPNTRYYAFFNDVYVGRNCVTGPQNFTSVLLTNSIGKIAGNFYLPAQTFVSGTGVFMLVDSITTDAKGNPVPAQGYTSASATYQSTGMLKNFQTNITTKEITTLTASTATATVTYNSGNQNTTTPKQDPVVTPPDPVVTPTPDDTPVNIDPIPDPVIPPTDNTNPNDNPNIGQCPVATAPQVNVWQRTVTTKVQQTNNKGQPLYTQQFGVVATSSVNNNNNNNFNNKGQTPLMTVKTTTETRTKLASEPAPKKSANTATVTYSAWTLKEGPIPDPKWKPPTAGVGIDPLAQSFRVDAGVFPNGLFLTQLVLYFKTVDKSSPVTLEIRNMINGMPGPAVLPGAKVVIPGQAVGASNTATLGTTFLFTQPVYLIAGEEYCFVVKSPSLGYELWCSRFGTPDIITNTLITDQPFSGILFKSANDSTWTPDQYEDIKFELYAAQFDTSVTSNLLFKPHRRKLAPTKLITGKKYVIGEIGGTSWTGIGAASNTVGTVFTYNGSTPTTTGTNAGYAYDQYYSTGQVVLYSDLSTTNASGTINVSSTTHGLITGDSVVIEEIPYASEFTGSISGTTLTVTKFNYGKINVGDYITGSGVTENTRVITVLTGSGGVGTYELDTSQTVTSRALVASKDVLNGIVTGNLLGEFTITRVDEDNFTITAKNSDVADRTGPVVVSDYLPLLDTTPPVGQRTILYAEDTLTTTNDVANSPSTVPSLDNQSVEFPDAPINTGVYSFKMYANIKVNEAMIDYLGTEVEATNVSEFVKLATATSTAGAEAQYEETAYVEVDKDGVYHSFNEPRLIATPLNENIHNTTLNGPSALVRLNLTSTDESVSPVIDMNAMSLIVKTYVIDNQDDELDNIAAISAVSEADYNDGTLNSEINPGSGKAAAKYKTRTIDLKESYQSLSIYVNANCPSPAVFDCYVRTSNDVSTHMDEDWVWVPLEGVFGTEFVNSLDKDTINEYFYYHTAAEKFTVYDMKFVMRSTNNSVIPKIYSIRSMANFE